MSDDQTPSDAVQSLVANLLRTGRVKDVLREMTTIFTISHLAGHRSFTKQTAYIRMTQLNKSLDEAIKYELMSRNEI